MVTPQKASLECAYDLSRKLPLHKLLQNRDIILRIPVSRDLDDLPQSRENILRDSSRAGAILGAEASIGDHLVPFLDSISTFFLERQQHLFYCKKKKEIIIFS